ncbi:class I SAM-dependent methyltransferase [Agrobacterium vitis]|uniref:Class I SAM-dependent methyltransferase n=1 Tax=Agrobacterium vitis TaxID=373 RepID=A0A7K1RAV9_AGRVI|nr:class I SAM-dependent methyltransferase [Agrobacterium vitis]MVA55290.1 hypothetical protein [Agrobacterium vitis]
MDIENECAKTFDLGPGRQSQRVEETSIRFEGNFDASLYGVALRHAFFQAWRLDSKLPLWIRQMEGGSGRKYRYLVNNLFEQLSGSRYLEIGSYKGSTLCSAGFGNILQATCVDHWQEFGGKKEFEEHTNRLSKVSPGLNLTVIESDFRTIDFAKIGKFDVFCFDGPHAEIDHYDGLVLAVPALEQEFVLIVDDWNMASVQVSLSGS